MIPRDSVWMNVHAGRGTEALHFWRISGGRLFVCFSKHSGVVVSSSVTVGMLLKQALD